MMCAVSLFATAQTDEMSQQGFTQVHQSDSTIFWLSDQAFSFVEAQTLAAALGAHLATFSTLEESNAVSNAINSANVLFGLYQDSEAPLYAEPAGGWTWVTGEEFSWSNWDSSQPNNTSSVYGEESVGHLRDNKKWNDVAMLYDGYQALLETPNVPGCTSPTACNFDPAATSDDGTCELPGCMDTQACNYSAEAVCDDGNCDYTCCPGPGCCLGGQHWDWELNGCVITNPSDSNFDGCVQLNDLLDLLSAYGDCAAEGVAWQCGDPLEYQGYDYATVLIGDQCWFAENLRSENYENGDAISSNLSGSEWSSTTAGAVAVYGEPADCYNYSPDIDACDHTLSLSEYGRLYNWYAVDDARGLCPSGWHVPTDGEWMTMEMALGMGEAEANGFGWRGTDQGSQMKTTYGWYNGGNGTNSSGFSGLPGGDRDLNGNFGTAGRHGYWWSSSPFGSSGASAVLRYLNFDNEDSYRYFTDGRFGFSVRCVRDAE